MSKHDWLTQLTDTFFNGRRAPGMPEDKSSSIQTVTVQELIRRGTSHVKVNGKIYRIEVTEHKV